MNDSAIKIMAVSVARPQWQDVRGRQVLTSIVRLPAPGDVFFGPDGPPDNLTAVHTAPVLAFSAEHYDYWTRFLQVPRDSWDWCHWGENITLTGLDENDLRIGDVIDFGDVKFVVNSPRNPCFKLAWRLGQPDSILRTIVETGLVGIYLSVASAGFLRAGQEGRLMRGDPTAPTVGETARVLMGISKVTAPFLRRALAMPELGDQVRGMLKKRLVMMEDNERLTVGRWSGWRPFDVGGITQEAHDICSFELRPADGLPIAPYRAGQFLTLRLSDSEAGAALSRTWTLSDYQDYPDRYRLTIKRSGAGAGSDWMHGLASGRRVLARPPAGRFALDRSGFGRIVLISAGIGITPMLAMLKARLQSGDEGPPLVWIHVTQNSGTHVRAAETNATLAALNAQRLVFYSRPLPEDVMGVDYDEAGRLTAERLRALIEPAYDIHPFGRPIPMEGGHSDCYVCGPTEFEAMVRQSLLAAQVHEPGIHSETFGHAAGARSDALVEHARVTFERSQRSVAWTADEDLTLLELAEKSGLTPNYGCRLGQCGACEVKLSAGKVAYAPNPAVPPAPGHILTCCARPASAELILEL